MSDGIFLRAQYDYHKTSDEQISLQIGDIVQILKDDRNNERWNMALKLRTNEKGFIPISSFSSSEYIPVKKIAVPYVQPVVLLGSMKNQVQDHLLSVLPQRFATSVPHTTRKPRENEVNGVDYHFVKEATMRTMLRNDLFVDCGEYEGNLYGTTEAAVRMVAQREQKHCVLDTWSSLSRLSNSKMYAIAIFVGASSIHTLLEMRSAECLSEFEAREAIASDNELLSQTPNQFHCVIRAANQQELFRSAIEAIDWFASNGPWIPIDSFGILEKSL